MSNTNRSADALMAQIIIVLIDEIKSGVVYPLVAKYSKNTCDRESFKDRVYPCVNIKHGDEIIAVDVYSDDNEVTFSIFRRIGNCSMYMMERGTEKEDEVMKNMIDSSRLKDKGFLPRRKGFERMEMSIPMNVYAKNNLVAELRDIVLALVDEQGYDDIFEGA